MIKQINTFLIAGMLLLLTISSIYAQVGSTGFTSGFDAVESAVSEPFYDSDIGYEGDEIIGMPMIMPQWNWCSFDYSKLSDADIEDIKSLEKKLLELYEELEELYVIADEKYEEIYNSVFPIDYDYNDYSVSDDFWGIYDEQFSSQNWDLYYNKIEELELELGIIQIYDEMDLIEERIDNYFDGCYNPYDEEWIKFKLSDNERQRYEELQKLLTQSYEDESELYNKIRNEANKIYEDIWNQYSDLEEELGIQSLENQIRELQEQISLIRRNNQDQFDLIWENQFKMIEKLEEDSGITQIRNNRRELQKEIQELTGSVNLGFEIFPQVMYARNYFGPFEMTLPSTSLDSREVLPFEGREDIANSAIPREMNIDSNSIRNLDLKSICQDNGGNWLEEFSQCEYISSTTCSQIGGEFNECGSACRNDPNAEICTMQCVPYCDISNTHTREVQTTNSDDGQDLIDEMLSGEEDEENINENGFISRIRSFFTSIFTNN